MRKIVEFFIQGSCGATRVGKGGLSFGFADSRSVESGREVQKVQVDTAS